MNNFKIYQRSVIAEICEYRPGATDLRNVSISQLNISDGSPKKGDMIARDPKNHNDMWLVTKEYFENNYEELEKTSTGKEEKPVTKTLKNTNSDRAQKNVSDIKFWGEGDTFQLISKAHSEKEGWMKSTKAMYIGGVGCVVQITTQQGNQVAEAVAFVPGVFVHDIYSSGEIVGRELVAISHHDIPCEK